MSWVQIRRWSLPAAIVAMVVWMYAVSARPGQEGAGPRSSGQVALRYMAWGKENEILELKRALADFARENPDIHVQVIHATGMYQVKLATMLAGGLAPDVFMVHNAMLPALAERRLIQPLDELIRNDPDLGDLQAKFLPEVVAQCRYKPAWSDQPLFFKVPAYFNVVVMYYNKDLFDAAGVAYPEDDWTWQEFLEKAKKLTRRENGRITQFGCMGVGPWLSHLMLMWQNDGEVFDEQQRLVIGRPAYIEQNAEALEFCAALVREHKVQPSATMMEALPNNLFKAGRVAMQLAGTWQNNQLRDLRAFRWDLAPPPRNKRRATLVFGGSAVMSSRTRHREAAWRLLKFFLSDRWQRTLAANGREVPAKRSFAHALKIPGIPDSVRLKLLTEVLPYARPGPTGVVVAELMEQRLGPLRDRVLLGSLRGDDLRAALRALQRTIDEHCPRCSALR